MTLAFLIETANKIEYDFVISLLWKENKWFIDTELWKENFEGGEDLIAEKPQRRAENLSDCPVQLERAVTDLEEFVDLIN
ncbi:MAG: hypothetical protein OEZ34_04910 [Spirochaetia bacterium]|nr:hypothetical protein [Spirochaetia bacterium]